MIIIKISKVVRLVFFILTPPVLAYLGSDKSILDYWKQQKYIGEKVNLGYIKQIFLFSSVIIPSIYLTIRNEYLLARNKTVLSQRSLLLNLLRSGTLAYFQKQIKSVDLSSTRIRIFIRKKRFRFKKWWKIERQYQLMKKHIDGLCTPDSSNGLIFKISPDLQGVVAECYDKKQIVYEDSATEILNSYNLDSYQKVAYTGISFWLCAPIINNKGEVVAVLSFESIHCIDISDSTKIAETDVIVTNFSKDLYDNCPELFK